MYIEHILQFWQLFFKFTFVNKGDISNGRNISPNNLMKTNLKLVLKQLTSIKTLPISIFEYIVTSIWRPFIKLIIIPR